MARIAKRHGTGRLGQVVIVAICLLNPLIDDALYWGHPEELLTASLAAGSLLAACDRRVLMTALLAGLAVASKQWALLIVAPALLALEHQRIRAGLLTLAVAAGCTLPMIVANFAAFRHALTYISSPQPVMTLFTWLYPFSSTGPVRVSNIFDGGRVFRAHRVYGIESAISHPLIIGLGVVVPLLVSGHGGWRLPIDRMLVAAGLVFVLRCTLDPGSVPYYHFPILLILLAVDATSGRRLPLAGLAGAGAAFVVLDRFPTYLGPTTANVAYIAATMTAVAVLARYLRPSRQTPRSSPASATYLAVRRPGNLDALN